MYDGKWLRNIKPNCFKERIDSASPGIPSHDQVAQGQANWMRAVAQRQDGFRRRLYPSYTLRSYSCCQCPDLPPIFSTSLTPSMRMPRSTALHMS